MIYSTVSLSIPPNPLHSVDFFSFLKLGKLIAFPVSLHNWNNLELESVLSGHSGQALLPYRIFL